MRLVLIFLAVLTIFGSLNKDFKRKFSLESDLGITFLHAQNIKNLSNPYKNMPADLKAREKYPPYFPLSYISIVVIQKLTGTENFEDFVKVWYLVCKFNNLVAAILIALLFYKGFFRQGQDRLTLLSISVLVGFGFVYQPLVFKKSFEQLDAIAFSLMLTSLLLLVTGKLFLSSLFLALSICFKQSFLLVLPSLLMHSGKILPAKKVFKYFSFLFIFTFVIFLPFLLTGFWETIDCTIFFHITRENFRQFLGYPVPYPVLLFPSLKLSVLLYLTSLVYVGFTHSSAPVSFCLPTLLFFMFHKYPLEQYLVVVFYGALFGILWESNLGDGKARDSNIR
ncbi:MAG: hypothetical protein N2654_03535, partial [Deltaproteobacteria bacterium]|nr:hypothetical protein [Deltaproteobacteria bacterium]